MRASASRRVLWTLAVAVSLLLAGCARNAPQDYLEPEGPMARQLDKLWNPTFAIAAVIFFLVQGLVLFSAIRFRARSDDERPKQVHGNVRLEFLWTVIPLALLAGVGVFTLGTLFDIAREPTGDVLDVEVIGHQFWWEYRYPGLDITTANELHIPVGRPVRLRVTAEEASPLAQNKGVIHSFWIPKLAGKQDAVPGRVASLTIEAERPGRYQGQCTEFCGVSHANMRAVAVAHEPSDFDDWVEGQQRDAPAAPSGTEAAEGEKLFAGAAGCAGCHAVKGLRGAVGTTGPDLTHLQSREVFAGAIFELDDENLRKWLRDPPGRKPMLRATGMFLPRQLTEEEITQLIAYLDTLE